MKEMILKFWKKWFGKESAGQVMNIVCKNTEDVSPQAKRSSSPSPMLEQLETYLSAQYDFRFNLLTEQTEYRTKGEKDFKLVDQRTLNTL